MGLEPNPTNKYRTVDNGVLFLAQANHVMVNLGEGNLDDLPIFLSCLGGGYLHRSPRDPSYNMPDDYYGFLSYCLRGNLPASVKIVPPGSLQETLQMYQPMLHYMRGLANGRLLWHALSPLMAIILATSNLFDTPNHVSDRMLTWTIIQGLQSKSLLCKIGGKVWTWRMKRQYGSIKHIAKIYFGDQHPIAKYMVD